MPRLRGLKHGVTIAAVSNSELKREALKLYFLYEWSTNVFGNKINRYRREVTWKILKLKYHSSNQYRIYFTLRFHLTCVTFESHYVTQHFALPLSILFTYYAREIWKRSFISTVRSIVHTNPLRKWSFSKNRLMKRKEFENAADLRLICRRKTLWKRSFSKRWRNRVISLPEFFSKLKSKIAGDCCFFTLLRCSGNRKHSMHL